MIFALISQKFSPKIIVSSLRLIKKISKISGFRLKNNFLKIHLLSKISLFQAVPGCFFGENLQKVVQWGFLGDKNLLILKFKKYQKLASKT